MAGKSGTAAKGTARSSQAVKKIQPEIVALPLTLTQKVATKIGRVKKWEDRSRDTTLELTGRR
jgi:hypothetical protein